MLPPEAIDRLNRIRREQEERDRPAAELPLYPPEGVYPDRKVEDSDREPKARVIVIDLA